MALPGIANLLAVGDCITRGVEQCEGRSYPELVAERLGCRVTNQGFTMSTSREGIHLLQDSLADDHDCVIIQFGVADSHVTFRFAPYIPYYPDRPARKIVRNMVKKYKKLTKRYGLNKRFGEARVVPENEYRANYLSMLERCGDRLVILPETIPQKETFRNPGIKRYNRILEEISKARPTSVLVRVYDEFIDNMASCYLDKGHPNEAGYELLCARVLDALERRSTA